MNNTANLIQTYTFTLENIEHPSFEKLLSLIESDEFKLEHINTLFQAIADKNSPEDVPGPINKEEALTFYPLIKKAFTKFSSSELTQLNCLDIINNVIPLENKDIIELLAQKGVFGSEYLITSAIMENEEYHLSLIKYCNKKLLSGIKDKIKNDSYNEKNSNLNKFLYLFNIYQMKDSLEDQLDVSNKLTKKQKL